MPISRLLALLPALGGLRVESIARTDQGLVLQVSATRRTARSAPCVDTAPIVSTARIRGRSMICRGVEHR